MNMKTRKSLLLRQLLLAATLAFGFGAIWLPIVLLAGTLVLAAWNGKAPDLPPHEELLVKRDGTLLIKNTPSGNEPKVTIRDARDQPAPVPPPEELAQGLPLFGGLWVPSAWPGAFDWQWRIKSFYESDQSENIWYFIHDGSSSGAGYFVGFDRSTNRPFGYIGDSGFRSDRPPRAAQIRPAQFAVTEGRVWEYAPGNSAPDLGRVYVASGVRLLLVDLQKRTLRTAFESAEPIESLAFFLRRHGSDETSRTPALAIRTSRTIIVLNVEHGVMGSFTIPGDSEQKYLLTWYQLEGGDALAEIYHPWGSQADLNIVPRLLFRVAPDGSIRNRREIDLQSGVLIWQKRPGSRLLSIAFAAPFLYLVELFFVSLTNQPIQSLQPMLESSWPSLLAVTLLGLALSFAAWRRARAFGLPRPEQAAWAIFVFLLALAGYVGFLLHRRWPLRAECPHCHARVPRDRPACARCKLPFPGPVQQGIEVFA